MKFQNDSSADEQYLGIDLTSMIDVLFVLLLFFMVTTTFSNVNNIPVNLPETSANKTAENKEAKEVSLTITEDKKIFIAEKNAPARAIAFGELGKTLKDLKLSNPGINLNLLADKNTSHGTVVEVLDQAKQAGIDNVGINTKVK